MLHFRGFVGLSIHLEYWNAFRFGQSNELWKKILDIQVWVLWMSSRGRPENVLGTSWINLPGTSLERQIRTSSGRHFRTSPGRQIGTSPGRSNRIFRGRPGDVGGGRPRDVLGTNICRLGIFILFQLLLFINRLFFVILCRSFFISSWFNTTVTGYLKHLISFLLIGFIVNYCCFLSNQENLNMIYHDLDSYYDNYNKVNEHNQRKSHYLLLILNSIFYLFLYSILFGIYF